MNSYGSDRLEELEDLLEVARALEKLENSNLEEVSKIADTKSAKRGAFEKRIFLEQVIGKE